MMAASTPLCYHGALSRKDCEVLLGKKNKDGSYLIRDSETIQGAMCLCVYKKKVVYTYRLLKTVTGHYTLLTSGAGEEIHFKSLDELIRHYKRKNQGLVMHLRHSVKRKTALLIQATTQFHRSSSDESVLQPGPEVHQRGPSEVSRGHRRQSEMSLQQLTLEEHPRETHSRGAEPSHSQPPTEHEEVEYENVPDYVDVQPS